MRWRAFLTGNVLVPSVNNVADVAEIVLGGSRGYC